jgi:hypothetical protein
MDDGALPSGKSPRAPSNAQIHVGPDTPRSAAVSGGRQRSLLFARRRWLRCVGVFGATFLVGGYFAKPASAVDPCDLAEREHTSGCSSASSNAGARLGLAAYASE